MNEKTATIGAAAEFNPLTEGHKYFLKKIKQKNQLLTVMSGNAVQRGELAIIDKFTRAEAAVKAGVNLVIELPAEYALQSAEGFCKACVYLLGAAGIVDTMAFGSESGDLDALRRETTYPNNLLGSYYMDFLRGTNITPVTIKRDMSLPPASAVRKSMSGISLYNDERLVMRVLRERDFNEHTEITEGLGNRLNEKCREARSLTEFVKSAQTRRYPAAAINRAVLRAYLGPTVPREPPKYLRVLAFDDTGAQMLKRMKKTAKLPVITKPARYRELLAAEAGVTDAAAFLTPGADLRAGGEFRNTPRYCRTDALVEHAGDNVIR